ncbi:MAG: hypothetical protein NZ895_01505 [Archaeoglobaceae archaeon]|nr:hypothetical protein [Archaeoglobaceae archaeon]MCX8151641.1 hypothetical protein [Archaeoglobaceae archaeon]MDW8013081.1 hypothetical protein [Archaeoglobaceae archaeon]
MLLLLLGPTGSGKCKLIGSVLQDFEKVIWISTVASARLVRKMLKKEVWIIDVLGYRNEKNVLVSNPISLSEIGVALSKVVENVGKNYLLVFNSISGLLMHHPHQKVLPFLKNIIARIDYDDSYGIFTLVKGSQSVEAENSILMLFPNIIEIEKNLKILKTIHPFEKREFEFESGKDLIKKILEI